MDEHTFLLEQERLDLSQLAHTESLFSLGNGTLGMRGFVPSRHPSYHPGVFINGFYETFPIPYGEDAYGFARTGQTMLDLPDCRYLVVSIDGEVVDPSSGTWRRILDMGQGVLTEHLAWQGSGGVACSITWETLLSMDHPSYGMTRVTVEAEREVEVAVHSSIALPRRVGDDGLDPRIASLDSRSSLETVQSRPIVRGFEAEFRTVQSKLSLYCGALHRGEGQAAYRQSIDSESALPVLTIIQSGTRVVLEKLFFYHRSEQHRLCDYCWDELYELQQRHWARFWQSSDTVIKGNEALSRAIRFNLFQLHQSVGRDGKTSLAAKGLTGLGYEGQYFWDTEIYAMPFFTHTDAAVARSLISYRISILDHARRRADELGQRGALFPWRTIMGEEASAYFPASTAQYHINADIAYALFQYLDVTGDDSILDEGGFALLVETARLWVDLGFYNERKGGHFCINEVTGPDEYSALVDNNLYTNAMAAFHLSRVALLARTLQREQPQRYRALSEAIALTEIELASFEAAAEAMYIPYDDALSINAQDDRFLSLQEWDERKRGVIRHPMLLHYHPLVIYRHRLIKQADTTLAMVLQPDRFPWYLRRRNFLFYETYTTGDSSLSAAIQAVAAFDCNEVERGMRYLNDTAFMDIANLHANTKDGLHTAAMAGSWMTIIHGLAGYRLKGGTPSFRPVVPDGIEGYTFSLTIGSTRLSVDIGATLTTYHTDGAPLVVLHRTTPLQVGLEPVSISTRPHCKAVIFDLDGVITSTDGYHYRAWKRLCDEQGWAFDRTVNEQLRGVSRSQSLSIILAHNNVDLDDGTRAMLCNRKNEWYRASLEALTEADILQGIPPLLEALREHSIACAVASSSHNAAFILSKLGLEHAIDYLVPAREVTIGKPDPEIFSRAAEALGVLEEECAAIEDAPTGIAAIMAAGMRSIGVGSAIDPETCDVHVAHTGLLDLERILF